MDRRQRKTREAIFSAFTELLAKKPFDRITVGEIIQQADVGRATFYAHFETKEFLLKELCQELFCHIFDACCPDGEVHRHIFRCDAPESPFLHLLQHLERNDHHILDALTGKNQDLFLSYFQAGVREVVLRQLPLFAHRRSERLPEDFWIDHIASVFVQTVRWWLQNGMQVSAEIVTEYFFLAVS